MEFYMCVIVSSIQIARGRSNSIGLVLEGSLSFVVGLGMGMFLVEFSCQPQLPS